MSCSMKKSKPQNKCGPISIMRIIHNHMLKVVGNLNYVNDKSQLQILNFIIYELWNYNWNTCQSQYIVVFPPALVEFPAIWCSAKSCRLLLLLMPVMTMRNQSKKYCFWYARYRPTSHIVFYLPPNLEEIEIT